MGPAGASLLACCGYSNPAHPLLLLWRRRQQLLHLLPQQLLVRRNLNLHLRLPPLLLLRLRSIAAVGLLPLFEGTKSRGSAAATTAVIVVA